MFEFTIEGKPHRINPVDPFGDGNELILNMEWYDGQKWIREAYPSIYVTQCADTPSTHAAFNKAISEINAKLETMYGGGATIPTRGFDLLRYLIDNKLELKGIELVKKP
ncbi:MAG: hypothetical protein Unbinned6354contig1000_16 [Prokaryotic dsDNA virus sp.]|nr:hypothetical protein [Cytophagaceae bacterium]QDP54313.1 MAG: hypothetical protein Unbinned6354contig1000_16 [Prokaryotic dsDNA virus sp.]|tara:strand:+ start:11603 stop:11929 length:327 start_codon:yes stop_codon:yes gene_type:complete